MTMAFPRMFFLILIQFVILQATSASSWHTLSAKLTIISKDGASGDFPICTDLAYEKAVKEGVVILDCNFQISKDKIPFCLSSIYLMNTTNVSDASFKNLSSTVSEIQQKCGIYTFSLTMSQIQTLKTVISNPKEDSALFRNPRNKNAGKFLTLSEFLFLADRYNSLFGILMKVENAVYLAEHKGIIVVDAVLDKLNRLTTQEDHTTSITILILPTEKYVFKEKKTVYHEELVYKVNENIYDVTDSAIKDVSIFAGSIIISKHSVFPFNGGLFRLKTGTYVVPRLKSSGFRVYVETFSNEFVTKLYEFVSDPTVEIDFFVRGGYEIDGIITDFPATTARYKKSQCYREMGLFRTGELVSFGNPELLSPAQAPYPSLAKPDVTEPPLSEVTPTKVGVKAIQVSFGVRTVAVLVSFFIIA